MKQPHSLVVRALFVVLAAALTVAILANHKGPHSIATNDGPVVVQKFTIDASAGGVAQVVNLSLLPANSVLIEIVGVVEVAFDGDASKNLTIGIVSDDDLYGDADESTVDSQFSITDTGIEFFGGVPFRVIQEETQLIATWTNTANATEGEVEVYVIYARIP